MAGNEEFQTFVYGTNYTDVTDARGETERYTYVTFNGDRRVSSQTRTASTTCPSAVASTFYNGAGAVDYTLDWEGNKTQYVFNTDTKALVSVTTAAGTASAHTQVNTWTGTQLSTPNKTPELLSRQQPTTLSRANDPQSGQEQT